MTLKGKREKRMLALLLRDEVVKAIREKGLVIFKPIIARLVPHWMALPKLHRISVSVLVVLLVMLIVWPSSDDASTLTTSVKGNRVSIPLIFTEKEEVEDSSFDRITSQRLSSQTVGSQTIVSSVTSPQTANTDWISHKVLGGDTLSNIFRQQELPLSDLYAISAIEGTDKPLSRLKPGQLLRFKRNTQGELDMIQIEMSDDVSVIFFRLPDGSFSRRQ